MVPLPNEIAQVACSVFLLENKSLGCGVLWVAGFLPFGSKFRKHLVCLSRSKRLLEECYIWRLSTSPSNERIRYIAFISFRRQCTLGASRGSQCRSLAFQAHLIHSPAIRLAFIPLSEGQFAWLLTSHPFKMPRMGEFWVKQWASSGREEKYPITPFPIKYWIRTSFPFCGLVRLAVFTGSK